MNLLTKLYVTLRDQGRHPLNRKSKFRAAMDFAVAQMAARKIPGDVCVPFPNDCRLLIPPHMKGAAHFIYPGLCEFEEMAFVVHFLRPDDLFVDVGANIGAYTILASGATGCSAISFEPNPTTFSSLLLNVRLNNLTERVKALNSALGREEGVLKMTEGLGTENSVCESGSEEKAISVRVTSMDTVLNQRAPVLLKMDVEGFETEVFAGGKSTLQHPALKAMIVEKAGNGTKYGFDENALHRQLRDASFVPCSYSPFTRRLERLPDKAEGNIIYVRELEIAKQRVERAPAFRYRGLTI